MYAIWQRRVYSRPVWLNTARRLEMCLAVELDLNITDYVAFYT